MTPIRISRLKASLLGFTLIELLVTISIIAVLAGIATPIFQRSMVAGRRAKGVGNLRTVGASIMSYAIDYNNVLPGPCALGVVPTVNSKSKSSGDLAGFLAPYLGMPDISGLGNTYIPVPVLVSPGMVASSPAFNLPASRIPHYIQSDVLKGRSDTGGIATVRPFGASGDPATDPIRLTRLNDFTSLTGQVLSSVQVWLLSDVDQQSTDPQAKASGWFTSLPKAPVYGATRLRVYADGHAAAAALSEP